MHKKIPVVQIDIDEETGVIAKVGTASAPERVPVGISMENNQPNRGDLNDWWQGRSIPASRQNIRQAMKVLGVTSPDKLLTKGFGLSLSDQYWVNPGRLAWEDVNFFDNPFSQNVGDVLFGVLTGGKINLVSPNNTSDGWLKKKWQITDGKRCLIKGGSDPFWQQPLNEVMATAVMRRLGIPHVEYRLIWQDGKPYSVCDNFITSETELVSAFYIHNTQRIKGNLYEHYTHKIKVNLYEHYVKCCESLGIPEILDQMLTVDYLIANSDRHMNNFGAVRNAETLEWICAAPLFDNGSSFWYNAAVVREDVPIKCQPFFETHDRQIELVRDFSWLNLGALAGIDEEFNELLKQSPLIDRARRDALCLALGERVKRLSDMICRINIE